MGEQQPRDAGIRAKSSVFLECEKLIVFLLMMTAGGYFGAFTYVARGGVFCNAQTGNILLMAMALGNGRWRDALYFIVPISAYCLGAFVSEILPNRVRQIHLIRWDTLLVLVEIAVVIVLGLLPEDAPVQITQVAVNFICSMQFNTFRQAEGIPMATTFCTNHVRQVGVAICKAVRHKEERRSHLKRMGAHVGMLAAFVVGAAVSTVLSKRLLGRAIWFSLIPLGIVLADLLYADLVKERGHLEQIPHGH